MISPEDLSLYKMTDNVDEAVDEILQFFRVYHSMRYVKNKLVLRLTQRPTPELLDRHQRPNSATSSREGKFEVSVRCRKRTDEPSLAVLPRLVFRFNRRSLGRLRQLIDCINRGYVAQQ